jgi:hypothetical protein
MNRKARIAITRIAIIIQWRKHVTRDSTGRGRCWIFD